MTHLELPLFLCPQALESWLGTPGLRVIAVDPPAEFEANHIPGAVRIDYADITHDAPPVSGLLPAVDTLVENLSAIGLGRDEHVVAYDRTGGGQAGRLLFTLDVLGHTGLSLLDGGLGAWVGAGLATESGAVSVRRSDYRAALNPDRLADRDLLQTRLQKPDLKLLDTRSAAEYAGTDVRAARGGHIPGAAHLDWTDLKDHHDCLRPREALLAELAERGITPDDEVVAYCQSHHRSSYAYFALKALGFERVRGYPGAWSDWGNTDATPVASGDS